MIRGRHRTACALALAVLLTGCSPERVKLDTTKQSARVQRAAAVPACGFALGGIDDQRSEPENLGTVAITRVDGEGFGEWFSRGIQTIPGYSPEAAPLSLRIDVLKAYIHSLGTLKSANIVVRVRATAGDSAIQDKLYRGVDGSMNWSSSQEEIQTAFNRAMASLSSQISIDLNHWCKNPSITAAKAGLLPLAAE